MSRVKETVIPPGGWHYPQIRKDGTTLKIESPSYPSLLEDVLRYRIDYDLDIGDVNQEVSDYICGLNPGQCKKSSSLVEIPKKKSRTIPLLMDRIKEWLNKVTQTRRTQVNANKALKRIEVCAQCPQNVSWHVSCGPCNEKLERTLFLVRNGLEAGHKDQIQGRGCRILGICHRTAVWLDDPKIDEDLKAKAPKNCWLNTHI